MSENCSQIHGKKDLSCDRTTGQNTLESENSKAFEIVQGCAFQKKINDYNNSVNLWCIIV